MRLIGRLETLEQGKKISRFLDSERISNLCESEDGEGCLIWVHEEDDVAIARQWFDEFLYNPENSWFCVYSSDVLKESTNQKKRKFMPEKSIFMRGASSGFITNTLLLFCVALFLFEEIGYDFEGDSRSLEDVYFGAYSSIARVMMYDMPKHPRVYWRGIYHEALQRSRLGVWSLHYNGPMFEKIQEGELWRLFTPALLHGGLLHICFNLLWLHVLGRQMELRLGIFRYLLFILVAAVISNFGQYLMSGFQFVGLSGVICAMIMFIWTRMNRAAWEGYQLQRSTMNFLFTFIFGIAALQMLVFFLELSLGKSGFSLGIANTAHIVGGVVGAMFARLEAFSWKR